MATDNEADLEIVVGARAEKGSGEKAAKNIEKEVLSTLDGGYIEVPVELKAPIKGASKKLLALQEDVIKQWEKTFKKGYSNSAKDLNELADLWRDFKKTLSVERKTSSKPARKMNELMGDQIQEYARKRAKQRADLAEAKAKIKQSKTNQPKENKQKFSQKAIDRVLEQSRRNYDKKSIEKRFVRRLAQGTSAAKARIPGSDTQLGYARQTPADKSLYATPITAVASEISAYKNPWKISEAIHRTEENIKTKQNTKIDKYSKDQLDEELERRRQNDPKLKKSSREIKVTKKKGGKTKGKNIAKEPEFAPEIVVDTWEEPRNTKARPTTEKEQKTITKNNALEDLAQLFKDAEKGIEITQSQLYETLDVAIKKYREYQQIRGTQKIGRSDEDELYQAIGSKIEALYTQSMKKALGGTKGGEKGVGPGHEYAKQLRTDLHEILNEARGSFKPVIKVMGEFAKDAIKINKSIKNATSGRKEKRSQWNAERSETAKEGLSPELTKAIGNVEKKTDTTNKAISHQTDLDKLENDRQAVLQNKQVKEAQNTVGQIEDETDIVQTDASTGLNTDSNSSLMLNALTSINDTLTNILKDIKNINNGGNNRKGGGNKEDNIPPYQAQLMLPPSSGKPDYVDDTKIYNSHFKEDKTNHNKLLEKCIDFGKIQTASIQGVELKKVFNGVLDKLKSILSGSVSAAEEAMTANEQKQKELLAERMRLFGVSDTYSNPSKTGAKTSLGYIRDLWNGFRGKKSANIFEDVQLSKGIKIDTTDITQAMQKVIERSQFKAQTGGVLSNVMMASTGGLAGFFLPSIEKTRAQIEGLNAIMGDTRNVFGQVIQTIQDRALKLQALQESGQAKFDDKGNLINSLSTPEAQFLVKDLEESKSKLRGILADISAVDQVIQTSNGRVGTILKRISFLSPELRKNNVAIQNLNAGLTKGGKALKFQTRMGEILNYTFQLMGRSIGQMLKNWMQQLNPITQIKKAFSDFTSYNTKWQRTMNVIKYNLRAALQPLMDKIAQTIVNIIGLVQSLAKGLGIFGKDFDLFDQSAASAEKMHEELEAGANVTASFDELHDIGSDNSGANDLMGDIYTPQWEGLQNTFENIGEKIKGIFDFFKGKSFWEWLAIGGAALAGFLILKTLLNWFKGKNPLQSVANGLSFLEKAVGWAILIWAFTEFTKALTDFVECMKTASWEDISKAIVMLGMAFVFLVGAIGALEGFAKGFGTDLGQLLGLSALVGAFALFTVALGSFLEAVKGMSNDELKAGFLFLVGALMAVTLAVAGLIAVLTLLGPVSAPVMAVLALVIASISLVIFALSEFVKALGENAEGVKVFFEGLQGIITAIADGIVSIITGVADAIATVFGTIGNIIIGVIEAVSDGITNILTPILDFLSTMVHTVGNIIIGIVQVIGDTVIRIIQSIIIAIPMLLSSILNFINELGPAINNLVDGICEAITKLINFVISAFEYMLNLGIDVINGLIRAANKVPGVSIQEASKIKIPRFIPQYEIGTNYVPNDGLAYLHQGEAVVPKKYNQPYQPNDNSKLENAINSLTMKVAEIGNQVSQGIPVRGEFKQRGSDLVAVVQRGQNRNGNQPLSNPAYAR